MLSVDPKLSEENLQSLKEYKYHAGTYTPIDVLLSKCAEKLLPFVPKRMSPNLITLIGFVVNVFGIVLLNVVKNEDGTIPRGIFLVCSICATFYIFMDMLDGKQARRLGCSSPLGQLFDHGCDSLNNFCFLYSVVKAIDLQNNGLICLMFGVTGYVFVSFQIIEYYQNVLLFGVSFCGVAEIECGAILITTISGVFGTGIWSYQLPFGITLQNCVVFFIIAIMGGAVMIKNIEVIIQGSHIPEEECGQKNNSRGDHFKRFIPLVTISAMSFFLGHTRIMVLYPSCVMIIISLAVSHYSIYCNVHHLCKKQLMCDYQGHIILFVLCVLMRKNVDVDLRMMMMITGVATLIYSMFIRNVLNYFKNALCIDVFGTKFKEMYPCLLKKQREIGFKVNLSREGSLTDIFTCNPLI